MHQRIIKNQVENNFFQGKIIIIVGPRQVGKTTLSLDIINKFDPERENSIFFNCDNPDERESLNDKNFQQLDKLIGDKKIVFIDEGQKVETIGQTAKLLIDQYKKEKQVIITGSSSINLLNKTEEPLTGRKKTFYLFPLSLEEIFPNKELFPIKKNLETFLLTGTYPEIISLKTIQEKQAELQELSSSNLYKDILEFEQIKNSSIIFNLLKALALQIGSEVSYTKLANLLGIDKKTVERYIDLLEKNFVIMRLSPYFTNKRKEISKSKKIYFYDLGIRNSIIKNFNPLDLRNDQGALWENFLIMERIKHLNYHNIFSNNYFWRTFGGTEIDWVEEKEGKLFGFEFKFNQKQAKAPESWKKYPSSEFQTINLNNFEEFIL